MDWCRKGYDGVLQRLESFLIENPMSPNQEETFENDQEIEPVTVETDTSVESMSLQERKHPKKPAYRDNPKVEPAQNGPVKENDHEPTKHVSWKEPGVRKESESSVKHNPTQSELKQVQIEPDDVEGGMDRTKHGAVTDNEDTDPRQHQNHNIEATSQEVVLKEL